MQTADAQQAGDAATGKDHYQIRVQGHLDQRWSEWFGGIVNLVKPEIQHLG